MDSVNNWKKILLQWIKECNFLEKNFYSLDQTEIEVFFMHFKDRFKEDICKYNNLSSFLKDQYPLFEPHFDDEDTLSSGDHIYVYSLLLHFSCVRYPDAFFQENCQKLNELAQRNIAAFFQKLLNDECLTKETLRHIIASIQLFTPPSNRFVFNAESPMKTPRKPTDISPPTPRSCMLQEKSNKVHALKAQLETLGYEKSVLETDLKLYLDKIDKLNHEVKRSNQQIADLKNDILSKSTENGDCGIKHTGEEQIRRLSKKIAMKEREISQQKETIEDLTEQKDCLNEKLKNAEKQMKILQSNMADLSEKVDDLSQELEQKEHTIQNLSDVKCELEQYISEIRSSTVNSRPDLNMSSEFLDYSRATNSSGSIHSPENLGSVVDIKLREKENENEQLLKEISSIRIDNKKLAKAMSELTARYSKLFDVCNENLLTEDEETTNDPTNYFIIFSNCIQSFAEKYNENCFALNRIKAEAKQIEEQNLSQANKLEETQKHNAELKNEIEELLRANKLLQTSKTSLENAMTELENKLENCIKERSEEANNSKNLQNKLENLKTQKLDAEHSFQQQIENLNSCLELKENLLTQLKLDNENKVHLLINENQQQSEELCQEKRRFEKEIFDLKNVEMHLLQQLDHEKSQRTYLSCELEKSKNNYDALLSDKKHLTEKNEQQIDLLQKQIQTLTDDQNFKASIISKQETDTESLVDSMLDKIQNLSNAIDKYEKIFEENTSQLTELEKKLLHTEVERNSSQTKLQEVSFKFDRTNEILRKVTTYTFDLVKVLKHRLGAEINETTIDPLSEYSCDFDDIERIDTKLKAEAKCLMDEIESFTMGCEYAVKENAFLRAKLAELDNTIENLNKEKSSLEKKISHLETEYNKQICVIDNLVKSEENLRDENTIMTSSIELLKTEILNKTNDAETLLEKQNQADKLLKELQEKIFKLESDLTAADEKDEEHAQELKNVKVQLDIEIADKIAIKEKLHKTTEEITQLETKISFLETQLRGMKEEACNTSDKQSREFDSIEIQLKNVITEKQHISNELTSVRLQFENVQKENIKITEDLENIKLQLETEINEKLKIRQLQTEATQKQQEELQTVRLQLETEFTKIEDLIADLANTKVQLESEVKNKHQLQREFEEARSHLEKDITTYKMNLAKAQHELEEEVVEKSKMTKDFESTKLQLESEVTEKFQIRENLKETRLQLERKLAENQQITEDLQSLKLQLESKVTETCKVQEDLENANKALNVLRLKVTDMETECETQNKLNANYNLQLENEAVAKSELKEKLDNASHELKELQTRIANLETKNEGLNQKTDEYNMQLEEVRHQLKNEASEKCSIREALEIANKQMNERTHENALLANKYQILLTEVEKYKNEVEKLQNKENRLLGEIELIKSTSESKMEKYNESTKLQLESEVTEKIQITENLKETKQQLERKLAENQEIREDLQSLKLQLENKVTESCKVQEDLENANKALNELRLKVTNLETKCETQNKLIENSKTHLENEALANIELKEKLEMATNELKALQTRIVNLETNNEGLNQKTDEYNMQLEEVRHQLKNEASEKFSIREALEIANKQMNERTDENALLANNYQVLLTEVEKYKNEVEQLQNKESRLLGEIEMLKSTSESKMAKYNESTKLQLESEVTEKIQITENLKKTKLQLERKLAENQEIREDLQSLKLQLESKVTESCKVQEDLENAKKTLNELRLKVTNLETKCETQNKLIENSKTHLENEALANTELKEKLEKATNELKALQTRIVNLENNNEGLNQKTDEYNMQLEEVRHQLKNEASEKCSIREALEIANKQMNERTHENTVLENKYQVLLIEVERYRNEVEQFRNKETRLLGEIEMLKSTNDSEIKKCNKEAEEQKENVSRLIQEIASMRKEKEFAEEERKILSKRLECYLNEQTSRETNQKSVEEKLQLAQKEVLVKLNLIKTEQLKSQDLENQLQKIQLENAKLKETAVSNMKRIEKQALSLGESQAICRKLKKETEVAQNNLEMIKSSTEATQRENIKLNQECKSLKEKLSKSEKSKDQLESRTQTLVKEIENLIEEKKNLETSENDLKTSNSTLEKIKHNLEDKVRKLAKSLSELNVALSKLEQDKVQLNLEVGGLNKQLQENKTQLNMKLIEIENLTSNLIDAKNTNSQLIELNEKHQSQAKEIDEENCRLNDQLSKLSLRLEITQQGHESTKTELEQLKSAIESSKLERNAIERDHQIAVERLTGIEGIVEEQRRSTEVEFANKIKSLEMQISKLSTDNCNLEELRSKDKLMIEQLNEDIMIFEAKLKKSRGICEENEKKWSEEKELLSAEVKASEERIKETRLELEGKLEKMKNKMKTLYNDEVTKMKKKQEREVAVFKTDIDSLKAKNEKHEAHIKKLSSQIFRLNENILEYQKENTFLKTKLNDLENKPRQLSRVRPVSSASAHQVLSSNLRMEDEEGEIFNNTYLSDLKDGRMSEYFNTDICAQELQYRNSLLPPHLKSTYLAQFDHQMGEDEIRDTPTLDDSSSTLLNTGQRKKVSGATSYKRPGPPTPSKNAGRLSFGGIGELNREILKESHDMASCSLSSSKTPAKFKFFSSKLSMKGDERKSYVTNFKKKLLSGGTIQCSSTPRKSKAHIDQRRLLDQIMSTASPRPELSPDCIVKPAVNLPSSLKKLELNRRLSLHKWRMPQLTYASDSGNSDVNSPQMKDIRNVNGSSGSIKRSKRSKDRRGSIYLRGSMFARNCRTPTMGLREVFKKKSKIQRNANFNKFRHENLNEMLIKKASLCSNNWDETCNNNNDEFFLEDLDIKKHIIEDGDYSCGEDDVNNDKTSKHFQQLLEAKESNAPFEISEINSNPSCSHVNNSSSNVHSRIIYGASVILNRKIPNVRTTMVRKSSIYVKGHDGKSVILVTNQTITLKDLAHMWLQMNVSAKSVIGFCFIATLVVIISLIIQFIRR